MSNKRRIKVKKIPMKVSKGTVIERFMTDEGKKLSGNSDVADRNPEDILMAIHFGDRHVHVVYPEDEVLCQQMVEKVLYELDLEIEDEDEPEIINDGSAKGILSDMIKPSIEIPKLAELSVNLPRRIVFHNRQAIGDILMFTCAIRDFKKAFPNIQVQVDSTVGHIWDHNPNINRESWPLLIDPMMYNQTGDKASDGQMLEFNKQAILEAVQQDKPVKLYIGPGKATNASNRSDNHFANAYRTSMENVLGVSILQGPIRADIYMTEEEYNRPPIIEGPYWLITAGEKGDWTCKTFAFEKWREVVKAMPMMTFVQIGEKEKGKKHKHPDLNFPNVINYIGKTEDRHTGIRDLFNLFNYCEGSMGLVSFQMHLAAAFNKPCITIAGAREPVWFTRYPGQQYLATDGCLPCTVTKKDEPTSCWFCDIKRCPHQSEYEGQKVPLCADLFTSDDVLFAIKRYYKGGRLKEGEVSGKSKLVNVVKEQSKVATETKEIDMEKGIGTIFPSDIQSWGYTFGGSSITDKDWEFIAAVLKEEKVKRVLEFGSGFSTLLMMSRGIEVVSFEARQQDIDRLKKINPDVDVRFWNGIVDLSDEEKFDLVFVDGPAGGENREPSFKMASNMADKILVHDAGRAPEKEWIEKHLKPKFSMVAQGGHRTAFFKLAEVVKVGQEEKTKVFESSDKPLIKVVFNGRGDGGAEHSTTWIMNEFVRQGWRVLYVSPNAPSGTFRREGSKDVAFTNNLGVIPDPCDILFLYCNDWIWEFKNLNEVFSNLQAKRKVMTVNYRLGDVGSELKAPWTLGWDKYLFLNSSLQASFKERIIQETAIGTIAETKAMAPPTDLSEYFDTQPNYNGNLRIVRHSSQGDVKYPKDFSGKVRQILDEIPNSEILLMPAPSFLSPMPEYTNRVHCHQKNVPSVKEFLGFGNVFWYHLPEGYEDQGPKTIMESMSAGLTVVADNHSGAKDRVIENSGILCNTFKEHLSALKFFANEINQRELYGKAAREHAKKEFVPERWIEEIIGA